MVIVKMPFRLASERAGRDVAQVVSAPSKVPGDERGGPIDALSHCQDAEEAVCDSGSFGRAPPLPCHRGAVVAAHANVLPAEGHAGLQHKESQQLGNHLQIGVGDVAVGAFPRHYMV